MTLFEKIKMTTVLYALRVNHNHDFVTKFFFIESVCLLCDVIFFRDDDGGGVSCLHISIPHSSLSHVLCIFLA